MSRDFVPEVITRRRRPVVDDSPAATMTTLPRTMRVGPALECLDPLGPWVGEYVQMHLAVAVPITMLDLQHNPKHELIRLAKAQVDTLTGPGSEGITGYYLPGKSGPVMHALTVALACAALTVPGGVTLHGLHWCVAPPCPMCPDWVDGENADG